MSPDQARRMAQHGRRLLTARIISPTDYAVLDALLWRCRRPGRSDLAVDYRSIARLAGVCRDTAIGAVRKLADIGLIQKMAEQDVGGRSVGHEARHKRTGGASEAAQNPGAHHRQPH
jgi:hypothetical protein